MRAKGLADDLERVPEIARIAAKLEPALRRAFLRVVESMQAVDLDTLVGALRTGNVTAVEAAIGLDTMADRLGASASRTLIQAVTAGAEVAATALADIGITMRFDLINPAAVQYAQQWAADLVTPTGITTATREAIRDFVEQAVSGQLAPYDVAQRLKPIIGLDRQRLQWLANFRARLEAEGVASARLEQRAAARARALIGQRATLIARTEIITAQAAGQQTLWEQAMAQGLLDPTRARKRWLAAEDERTCDICEELDAQEPIPVKASWTSALSGWSGIAPPAHPACRCDRGLVFAR